MSHSRSHRWIALVLLFLNSFWPGLASAQASRAGIVTTLQGQATVARPTITQPAALKFKDDLFVRDRVETKEDSLVRVLLGGKALVTIRELSVFTVTEEPGRAAVDLTSGRLAVGVAKSLLRPGEAIEIRTPNAVAGIRGSLLVAEVTDVGGVPQTAFTALQATVPITVATRAAPNVTVNLSPNHTVSVSGLGAAAVVGPVQPVTPAQAQRAAATATAPRPLEQTATSPLGGQIATNQVAQATQLASLIAPPPGATTPASSADPRLVAASQAQSQPPLSSTGLVSVVPPPTTAQIGVNQTVAGTVAEAIATQPAPAPSSDVPDVVITDSTVTLGSGQALKTYSGTTTRSGSSTVVQITNSQVSGPAPLLAVPSGANVTLNGPLLVMNGPSAQANVLTADTNVVSIQGRLTDTTTSPLFQLDPTQVTTGNQFALVSGGGTVNLAGPFLSATATSFKLGDPTVNTFGLLTVLDGSTVTSTSQSPMLAFDASTVDSAGNILTVRRSPSANLPTTLSLSGPLFSAVNGSTFQTSSLGLGAGCCSPFSVTQGSQLLSTTSAPLIQLSNSSIDAGPDARSGGNFFNLADTFTNASPNDLVAPSRMVLAGPLLKAQASSITALFNLLAVTRSSLTSTTPDPLIWLDGSQVSIGGVDPFAQANSVSRIVVVSASSTTPASLSLQGPLLSATNSTITSNDDVLGVFNGASLTSATAAPLISILGGSVTAGTAGVNGVGGNFISFASGVGLPPSVSLAGPLLNAGNTTLKNGDPTKNALTFFFVGDSAMVSSTTAQPLLSFDHSSVDTSGDILSVSRSLSSNAPTRLTLSGPLFSAINQSSFDTSSLGNGSPNTCCDSFFVSQGAQLSSTTMAPLIQLQNSTLKSGPDAQSGGDVIGVLDTFVTAGPGQVVAPATVTLSGPLFSATGSTVSALFSLLSVQRSSLVSTSLDPLIQLDGSTVSLGGTNPFAPATPTNGRILLLISSATPGTAGSPASVSLAGSLLKANTATVTTTADLAGVFNGATLTSTGPAPLVQFAGGTTVTTGTSTMNARLLNIGNTGGPSGTGLTSVTLNDSVLSSAGSTLNLSGGLVQVFSGGQMTLTAPTDALVYITGGTHSIAGNNGTTMFGLFGRGAATAVDPQSGLTLGTDRPIQGVLQPDGTRPLTQPLLETTGATVTGRQFLQIDTALLEATAPLLNANAVSALTTSIDAINLSGRAQVSLAGDMIRLDASAITVSTGALARVAGGSKLTVGGNFLNLSNGATLTLLSGPLLSVLNGSFASIGGALVNFGGTGGNAINVTNALAPTGFLNGVPVFSSLGGTNGFTMTNPTPLAGLNSLGTIKINGTLLPNGATGSSGITGSLVAIQAGGGSVKIGK